MPHVVQVPCCVLHDMCHVVASNNDIHCVLHNRATWLAFSVMCYVLCFILCDINQSFLLKVILGLLRISR